MSYFCKWVLEIHARGSTFPPCVNTVCPFWEPFVLFPAPLGDLRLLGRQILLDGKGEDQRSADVKLYLPCVTLEVFLVWLSLHVCCCLDWRKTTYFCARTVMLGEFAASLEKGEADRA